jgi:hypothetical protein
VTPEQYASFNSKIKTDSETWTHSLNFRLTNTDLFEMPAGPVGFAALAQVGKQAWDNPTDPRVLRAISGASPARRAPASERTGRRRLEFRVPLAAC